MCQLIFLLFICIIITWNYRSKILGKGILAMKKMTKSEQLKANGGWGAFCPKCGWHKTTAWWNKGGLKTLVRAHNLVNGHNAYIC